MVFGRGRLWRAAVRLMLAVPAVLTIAGGACAQSWIPPDDYLAPAGLTSADDLDNAGKGELSPLVVQVLQSGSKAVISVRNAGMLMDRREILSIFQTRWSGQAAMGRPAGEICLSSSRYWASLPTPDDMLAHLKLAIADEMVIYEAGETELTPEALATRFAAYDSADAIALAEDLPLAVLGAVEAIRAYRDERVVVQAVFDGLYAACSSGEFIAEGGSVDNADVYHCVAKQEDDFTNKAPLITTELIEALIAAGVRSVGLGCVRLDIALYGAHLERLQIEAAEATNLRIVASSIGALSYADVVSPNQVSLFSSSFSHGVAISGLEAPKLNLGNIRVEGWLEVSDTRLSAARPAPATLVADPNVSLDLEGGIVDGAVRIGDVAIWGNLNLDGVRGASLRLQNVAVAGSITLIGAQFGGTAIIGNENGGITVLGNIDATFLRAGDLELDRVFAHTVFLSRSKIAGRLAIYRTIAMDRVSVSNSVADMIDLLYVSSPYIGSGWAVAGSAFQIGTVVTDTLFATALQAGYATINFRSRTDQTGVISFDPETRPEKTCLGPKREIPLEVPALAGPTDDDLAAALIGDENFGCIGRLAIDDAQVATRLEIESDILGPVDLSGATIGGQLSLATQNARYDANSCVLARGLRVDTILLDPGPLMAVISNSVAPLLIDLYGAAFRIVRTSQAISPEKSRGEVASAFIDTLARKDTAQCSPIFGLLEPDELRAGYLTQLPTNQEEAAAAAAPPLDGPEDEIATPSREVVVDSLTAALRPTYQPAIYDALAEGFDNTGELDLARFIKIEKNRAFANSIDWRSQLPTKVIYWLAEHISGYGYDNVRAVMILIVLTAFGAVIGMLGEERIGRALNFVWGLLQPMVWPGPRRPSKIAAEHTTAPIAADPVIVDPPKLPRRRKAAALAPIPATLSPAADARRRMRHHIFFSLDRSIPSLGLDQDFSRHRDLELGTYISIYFYFQRLLSFLILVLMIAGAFEVFQ